jgi:transcription-repair coupling factor (superfamily II helicase)
MDVNLILEKYRDDDRTSQITGLLNDKNTCVYLENLAGAQLTLLASGVFLKGDQSHVFIMRDAEEAAYFENDINQLLPLQDVLFFPSSYKKPGQFLEADSNQILLRAQSIDQLIHTRKQARLLVTYPEAIIEKTVSQETLKENTLHLKTTEKVDIDFMLDLLLEYGFERVDFVYEPGEFSIRGGIIDVYSFGNDYPYRIELFDDEVESLRTFDPETQLSMKKISELTIIPNINRQFVTEKHTSLFEFLPENTVIWIRDTAYLFEVAAKTFTRAVNELDRLTVVDVSDQHPFKGKNIDQLFITEDELSQEINRRARIFANKSTLETASGIIIDMQGHPQPHFNRNFQLLLTHLSDNEKAGITSLILSENQRQLERFRNIFEDLKAQATYHPVQISLSEGFIDNHLQLACFTDHQVFERFHKYKTRSGYTRGKALTMRALRDLNPGDFVTHIDHGVGVFSGLERLNINGKIQESVRILYKDNDILYVNIHSLHKISKYSGKEGHQPKVHKLGTDTWNNLKNKTKKKVKDIAQDLIALYAKRKAAKGFAFSKDNYLQHELEASFMYEDTPDQHKATIDVKKDMEKPYPMDRLVCGDVGFGKTEVAMRAAFKAVVDGKQVAILVPTTILAWQHYKTFSARFADFPVTVDYINRFKSAKERKNTLEALKEGKVDIIIGTHALLSKDVAFKSIGLLVIDEEQKFGVAAKEKLRAFSESVDTLTLTATPIPRTLKFSLMGARDLSNIMTPPANRQPVTTEVHSFDSNLIKEVIEQEVNRGGQVFFVHNRVKDLVELELTIRRLIPGIQVQSAHGQMDGNQLEEVMLDFINGKFDVLVSTNIIEAGLDIPNANTIIINNAHHFGLSDLHQMRGRVGRSNKKAYCYLFCPPKSSLSPESRRRLQTLEEFSDLGSGFHIALKDLDIRGAGNLLGGEQSGFIADIGFDMYQKILDEAIQELKYTDFRDLFKEQLETQTEFVKDCSIETDCEMLIPHDYVSNSEERLRLYTELDNIKDEEGLKAFRAILKDRFGPIPKETEELFDGLRIRWIARKVGFERIILKGNKLRCYFIENPNSPFYNSPFFGKVMSFVQTQQRKANLKQSKDSLILVYDQVFSMRKAEKILEELLAPLEIETV